MLNRPVRILLASTAAWALCASLLASQATAGITPSTQADPVASGCSTPQQWNANRPSNVHYSVWSTDRFTPPHGSSGKVKYCAVKYKIKSSNPKADYYFIEAKSTWSDYKRGMGGKEDWTTTVTSSKSAILNEFDATKSITSTKDSPLSVSVSVAYGAFSVAARQTFSKKNVMIARKSVTKTGAKWAGSKINGLTESDLVYGQTVKKKAVPKFTVTMTRPSYKYQLQVKKIACTRPSVCLYDLWETPYGSTSATWTTKR